jgi:hypothetical protein
MLGAVRHARGELVVQRGPGELPDDDRMRVPYWHFALHVLAAAAFFAHVS